MKPLIVITGASAGIGAACARRLSAEGHPLLLVARRVDKMEALGLPNTLVRAVDVTDRAAFEAAVREAEAKFGPVDCLVNNAGVMLLGALDIQDRGEWRRMFELNVLALLDCMQVVLGPMKARKGGTIINISSVAGKKTFPNHAAYCGTKFAVSAMTENLRGEVAAEDVRVISICPGAVETELLGHTSSEQIKGDYNAWKTQMGGVLAPEDVAEAVAYAYGQPQRVCVREILLTPTRQAP